MQSCKKVSYKNCTCYAHVGEDDVYMLFANRQYLVQMYHNTTVRNAFQLSEGSNAIACDYDIRYNSIIILNFIILLN